MDLLPLITLSLLSWIETIVNKDSKNAGKGKRKKTKNTPHEQVKRGILHTSVITAAKVIINSEIQII